MYSATLECRSQMCPSIEDKVSRFKDKDRHQLFVKAEGLDTDEMYIQGMSSSLQRYSGRVLSHYSWT